MLCSLTLTFLSRHPKKQVNLSYQFRETGLTAGAKLELVAKSKTTAVVNIALRLPEAEAKDIPNGRLMEKFRNDTTLWKMLRHFEARGTPSGRTLNFTDRGIPQTSNGMQAGSGQLYYEMPVLRIMNREVATLADFQKTLSQLGLDAGSHMIQLTFKSTDQTLNDAMQEISQFFKNEEVAAAKEKDTAPKPEFVSATEGSTASATEPPAPSLETTRQPDQETAQLETSAPAPTDGAADAMDIDDAPAVNHDPLKPVGIFSAPVNNTPAAASIDVPDSYYTPSIAHAQAHQQKLQESAVNRRLKSDAEIEAEARAEQEKVAKVKAVEVKVRFPDQTSAQWVFGPGDTGATLHQAVRSVMANATAPFKLVLPGPPTKLSYVKDASDAQHKLIQGYRLSGRVLVNLVWEDLVPHEVKKQAFLKGEFAQQAKTVEVPDIPIVEDEAGPSATPQGALSKPSGSDDGGSATKKMPKWLKGLGGKK